MSERVKCALSEILEIICLMIIVWWVVFIGTKLIKLEINETNISNLNAERNIINTERNKILKHIVQHLDNN